MILSEAISPSALKTMTADEKIELCGEIRTYLIDTIARTGGHLASNLGTVELTVALHSVFDTPRDKLIFDVGHQAYTHKLLTGRFGAFAQLRTEGGLSGFPRRSESEHDAFIGGHSSISVSAALGIASAMRLRGEQGSVIAIVGDGALTGGEIFEGLNNAGKNHGNLIVVLNDNEMSISKNSGSLAAYLSQIRSSKKYHETKKRVKNFLAKSPFGQSLSKSVSGTKRVVKGALIHDNLFENLGFKYLGPVDGHDIGELEDVLVLAKSLDSPCLVHVRTKKGKGYDPAEKNSGQYHGVDKTPSRPAERRMTYSEVFGHALLELGLQDKQICAVTAAMKYATGCNYFAKTCRERFFDVGIAEQHAVTFCAGLAAEGMLPVLAVYSTFLQRGFDQLIHDAAIEGEHMVLMVDRAGLTGEDGETHQGLFDVPMLSTVPGMTIFSPANAEELIACFERALYQEKGLAAVRYPRGVSAKCEWPETVTDYRLSGTGETTLLVTYGRLSMTAAALCVRRGGFDVLQLVRIHPLPEEAVEKLKAYRRVVFFEESSRENSVGARLAARLLQEGWRGEFAHHAIDGFVACADVEAQLRLCGLDEAAMERAIFDEQA